jgi:hypothetical protein
MGERSDDQIRAISEATSLSELADALGADSIHDGYFRAKEIRETAVAERQAERPRPEGLPGTTVTVDGHTIQIHGVTHAGTEPEREYLRGHVGTFLDRGAVVYCEQGIRSMYFEGMQDVCEMDDYLWARAHFDALDEQSQSDSFREGLESVSTDVSELTAEVREAAFAMIDAGSGMYGERFEQVLGDVAAEFLASQTDRAVGNSYEAFRLSREASENPERLHSLQRYYERAFLPQPLEREWLRRHDPELELFSHARNERMADYVAYHNENVEDVHLIVGAAHQHGVAYYLEQYEDDPKPTDLELY